MMKLDIDTVRLNSREVARLKKLEIEVTDYRKHCRHCAYKEYNTGMCWYLMTTNKNNVINNDTCKHFVDIDMYLENKKESDEAEKEISQNIDKIKEKLENTEVKPKKKSTVKTKTVTGQKEKKARPRKSKINKETAK